jgi:hypothetical protein
MVKDVPPAQMRAIEAEIPAMLSEMGIDPLEFLKAGNESKFLRTAAAQKVLVDAARYRMIMSAKVSAASRPVPPVQRPGTSQPEPSASTRDWANASSQFNKNPSVKNAAALIAAARKGAR